MNIYKTLIGKCFVTTMLVLAGLTLFVGPLAGQGNQNPISVEGVVTNIQNLPIMGARVFLQESTLFTTTDEFGEFTIVVPGLNSIINIESEGFVSQTVTISGRGSLELTLEYSVEGQGINDKISIPWGTSDRRSITSSMATISHSDLRKSPVMNLGTAVSGQLSGFTVVQQAGSPGLEDIWWRIRGVRTLESGGYNNMAKGGVGIPTIIVDGFERDFIDLDAIEIESLSVLKDAAANALYGVRGGNGVILVTTKRGQANKRTINLEVSSGVVTPQRLPEYQDAYNYAKLFNEARINDGLDDPMTPFYSEEDLQKFSTGSDPITHPNVDFYDEFIKDYAIQSKAALSMSGGNQNVKYFVAMTYNAQDGLYDRTDENPVFETKTNYARYNTRINLDINITKRLTAALNLAGRIEERRYPYDSEANIFSDLNSTPPTAYPLSFNGIDPNLNKEIFMLGGNSTYQTNPLGRLSYKGSRDDTRRYYQLGTKLKYDLDFITEGLNMNFEFNGDGYNYYRVSQNNNYRVWDRVVQPDLSVVNVPYNTPSSLSRSYATSTYTSIGTNLYLTYDKEFGESSVKALAMWRRWTTIYPQANRPDQRIEDIAVRANYSLRNRYFLESTLTISGSDNFYLGRQSRYFLPSVSAGWIISDEAFMDNVGFVQFLKLRGSWGITANHEYSYEKSGYKYRLPYRDRWWSSGSQIAFGSSIKYFNPVVREGVVPNRDITVEKGRMMNIAIDSRHFDNKLSFSADFWMERKYDIFTQGIGSIPLAFGSREENLPIGNEGIVLSKGFEASLGWHSNGPSVSYWINGMVDYWSNKIEYMAEPFKVDDYRIETGGLVRQNFGLVALGLFKNQDDIDNSPVQQFGPYQPGDIKYKDMNDDGVINANDNSAIGDAYTFPQLSFALNMGMSFRSFDLSVLLQGSSMRSTYMNNNAVKAFVSAGSITSYALNRYTDEASWSTADYPRLTTLANDNNWRISTFWLKDASFLRIKNLELGYNLPMETARKVGLYGLRIFVNAYNLYTFDNIKFFDPEDRNAGVSKYPMTSVVNLGVNLKF